MTSTAIRTARVSFEVAWRPIVVGGLLAAAIAGIGLWSLSVGDFPVPFRDVIGHLRGDSTQVTEYIVGTLRLPRLLTGMMVGLSFGMAGAIVQSLTRNPLGSPDVLGLDAGAAAGAVFVIVFVNGSNAAVATGALVGGMVTAAAVFLVAGRRHADAIRLILVGIGLGALARAAVEFMLTQAASFEIQRALVWLTGSLNGRSWDHVRALGLALVVLVPLTISLRRWLTVLELGDDVAAGLGVAVARARLILLLLAVTLTSMSVAAAGPIAFVALTAAPIARRLTRARSTDPLTAGLVGALLVVSADLAARRVFAPTELPVGLATAAIGAPYLLWLLQRRTTWGRPG